MAWILSSHAWSAESEIEHLPLDMNGYEYRALLEQHQELLPEAADELHDILQWGKRNLEWIDAVNATRTRTSRVELSTPETIKAYPVESPKENNRAIVTAEYQKLIQKLPESIQSVIGGTDPIPTTLPVDDQTFLSWAREVDAVYQSTSRWLLQEGNLGAYAARSYIDIRGYYFLSKIDHLRDKLEDWSSRSAEERSQWRVWLIGVCRNSSISQESCEKTWEDDMAANGHPVAYYDRYWEKSRTLYEDFFKVYNPRRDAEFHKPNDFVFPFRIPENNRIQQWLKDNIEEEWRFEAFQLRLRFEPDADPRVVFAPGATPHVNGLGGNTITMDANRDIDEYLTRWTIRHEFGHVLGFSDCYVEFYDTTRKVMINYQIDTTNIMCSRRGHLQEQHVEELRRMYPEAAIQ